MLLQNSPSLPPQPSTPNEILALPSVLIDFMAMTVCDLIPSRKCKSQQNTFGQDRHPMPELVHFIQKITFSAGVNCRTALVALIYLDRAKAALPKGAAGGHDTPHRMFLASMLLASKYLRGTRWSPPFSPHQPLLPTVPSSWQHYYSYLSSNPSYCLGPLTNAQLSNLCSGLFSLEQVNTIERAFLKLIDYRCWVDDLEVKEFVLKHRVDFSL
ncbi:cyclin [Phycomyces blakesleeanus]